MKTEFKLVLYSLKDPKTVQNITQNINEVFEQDLFDAYVALPNNKHTKSLSINQFMSSTENRTEDNTYVIESWTGFIKRSNINWIPVPKFDGFSKDWTLFLWQRFMESLMDSDLSHPQFIKSAFSNN